MGRKRSKKNKQGNTQVYLKVLATFKCSGETCGKIWRSAHGWNRDEKGVKCDFCDKEAELLNAVDEMLKLDCYNCPTKGCEGNSWVSIHDGQKLPQKCEICEKDVFPEKNPQERFGRHYWFGCLNKECKNPQEWEDFSTEGNHSQRCTKCHSRGDIKNVQKLKPRPPIWLLRRRNQEGGGMGGGDSDRPGKPTSHNSEFCDMCQKIRREGKGHSCHNYRKVTTKVEAVPGGDLREVIVGASIN